MRFTRIALAALVVTLAMSSAPSAGTPDDDATLEKILTAEQPDPCYDYASNARRLIPGYYRSGKLDSIETVIQFVLERCPNVDFGTYRILREIQLGEVTDRWCADSVVTFILTPYRQRHAYFRYNWLDNIKTKTDQQYDTFLLHMAAETRDMQDPHSLAHAVALYYAGGANTVLARLADRAYEGTCLQRRYDERIDSLLDSRRNGGVNWSFNAGVWVPFGNLDLVGTKPEIGVQGGYRWRRLGFDLTWLGRFINSEHPYTVNHKDSLWQTERFFSMYLGIDPVVRLVTGEKASLELFGGFGYEGIMALNADDIGDDAADYIHSLGLNAGFTLRLFYGKSLSHYFGLQTRVSRLDYGTGPGGSPMSGGAVSINLIWGGMPHGGTDYTLERMHYYGD